MTLRKRRSIAAVMALSAMLLGCGSSTPITPEQRREADARWTVRFGEQAPHGAGQRFSLDADRRGDTVEITVRANRDVGFADSSLGAGVYAYRDGEWVQVGNAGVSLPAVRTVRGGDAVSIRLDVEGDGDLYRAAVFPEDGTDQTGRAWVDLPPP